MRRVVNVRERAPQLAGFDPFLTGRFWPFPEGIRDARREYGGVGTVHVFVAVPAGLAFLVGQLLNTLGQVQTYEHVAADGSGRYRKGPLLRPCD